ncbi:SDR family NAD(P)-dependent oxidoreductase [Vibrio sp. TRT 17S01]|uniref:SDR family NAD(P)-dependent oxidoreductase n=1 Tax=Vibrio sp. TRT 17S01 TaxID=3418505 RepID=UPI003CF2BD0E
MNVVIIGGTSGVGLGLAKHYLRSGHQVVICGRDISKVPQDLITKSLSMMSLDVSKPNDIIAFFNTLNNQPIDMLIYCAGKYFNERRWKLSLDEQKEMEAVNATGFRHCFDLAANRMITQGHGHLVTIASIAGLVNSSSPTLYSHLKAQMIIQGQAYAQRFASYGIKVTVIAPGYINTQKLRDLNDGDASHKPFLLEESHAVKRIITAIEKEKQLVIFPLRMKWLIHLLNCLPSHFISKILKTRR